jgi:hypothetical protein
MIFKDINKTFTESFIDGQKMSASWNNKEKAHRYKQKIEKKYILHRMIDAEKKVKQDEKIQEIY